MKANRFKLCKDAENKLKYLSQHTRLTRNLLLRVGFCLSLNEKSNIDPARYSEDGQELNRYTLTGEYDIGYISILKEWLCERNIQANDDKMEDYFRAHLNRGAMILATRTRSLMDIVLLVDNKVSV